LPKGRWIGYADGKVYEGGKDITLPVDATGWSDIPLFIREGAIIPQQAPMDYVDQKPVTTLDVNVFPAEEQTHFDYYDDDGNTYGYEKGDYFLQPLSVQRQDGVVTFDTGAPSGSYRPALRHYVLAFHGDVAGAVNNGGQALPRFDSVEALRDAPGEGWARGKDRYGEVTYVKITAGADRHVQLTSIANHP
jgi:alpha-glucosidase (family GH31 glycosyl hydrolase)